MRVINPTAGVMNCRRSIVEYIMRKHHLPCPPSRGQYGYWLKRGDMAVTVDNGIAYCRNEKELEDAKSDFAERGITDIVVQAHVRGDVVKFYGVEPKGFFRVYHVDDNESHYFYQKQVLQANAELLARLVGVQVYGGDAVITADGDAYIVDFNDWPSFSRCLCEAAEAIVKMVR